MSRRIAPKNIHHKSNSPTLLFSCTSALFFTPSAVEGYARGLSPLTSIYYALFCAMEPSQPLSHQSLPHSFPCNGGWGVSFRSASLTTPPPLPAFFCFQQVTHCPICNPFVLIMLQQWGGVVGAAVPKGTMGSLQRSVARPCPTSPHSPSFRAEQADFFFRVRSSNASACAVEESLFPKAAALRGERETHGSGFG